MLDIIKPKLAKIIMTERKEGALILDTQNGLIKIEPVNANILRIVYTLSNEFSPSRGLGIEPQNFFSNWEFVEEGDTIRLKTAELQLVIEKSDSRMTYFDACGNRLTGEPRKNGKELVPFDSYKTILDETAVLDKIVTPDGIKEVVLDAKKNYDRQLYHTRLCFEWEEGEALYGMGQNEEGYLNLRGTRQYIHQANMKIAMPFLMSTNGYGILLDTYAPVIFNDNSSGSYLYSEASAELDFYFIKGEKFDDIIGGYRQLTGRAAMLPLWAFGFMQSQERFETQQEILDTVKHYRELGVPLDSIVLDWQSWEEGMWGQKSFDTSRFPDAQSMTDQLHELDAHFMISIWPIMVGQCANHQEMKAQKGLFQRSEIYNAFDSDTRKLYWKQTREGLFSKGVDAWWCDSSEPFTPEWNNSTKPEPDQNMMVYHNTCKTYMDEVYTNAYPLMHAKGIFEGQRETSGQKRVVNLTRSGYTGIQKYGTILWSGDTCAKWSTLRKQIAAGLNYCASGLPYWTLDIGAFFVKQGHMWYWEGDYENGCDDLGYRELYTRWYQLGTFLPVFRSHGTDCRREIWNFGKKGEMFYDAIEKFTHLRYRLMPYIYSLTGMVTQKHDTIFRVLAFDFINDKKVYNIDDQFMFGPSLMICPITTAMYYGIDSKPIEGVSRTRTVYLPEGTYWYDFWSEKRYEGGQLIEAESPIDKIPIYVKAGAILPMSEPIQHTGQMKDDLFWLLVYPGADGKFTLYQDERNGYGYEEGKYATTELVWSESDGKLTIHPRKGKYPGMPENVTFVQEFISQTKQRTE
jgi:alpha-D-xyloside xylohydrolase